MTNAETTPAEKTVAAPGPHVALQKATLKKGAAARKGAPQGRNAAKAVALRKGAKAGKKAPAPRADSKGANIIEMIGRAKGATLAEIMKAARWQAHSVRGFLSVAAKKYGIKIESTKNAAGDRLYKIVK